MGDFDFYVGTWDVVNRRLTKRHVGSDDWDEFPAVSVAQSFFNGGGNFDEISFPTKGWSGCTLRLFDPKTEEWSLYWVNSREGLLTTPTVGRFENGVGEFYCDDIDEGIPVRVRYRWSDMTADSAHWEQAFSTDGEKTWETNWIMDSRRRS